MQEGYKLSLLGTGLIGMFYTLTLHKFQSRHRVHHVYSRSSERAKQFAGEWGIPKYSTDLKKVIEDPETDAVVIGLPNHLHLPCVEMAVAAGKAILCTKPLGRNAAEAKKMLDLVEKAGVFAAYLEDLVYTPKTLKSLESVRRGALGKVLWVRSRETHPGPHSAWFWDIEQAGGGALIDMGCHCAEIIRAFVGKEIKPVEAVCWADTLVHNIPAEDHAVALIRFQNGAVGQIEVSWAFRGGMDLRDEVAGTEGTIWLDHFLRTGFQMFTNVGQGGYVAEKAEGDKGWLFPVGDEVNELGYTHMFLDVFEAMEQKRPPMETFYDGYVVNAVLDACYRSAKSKLWEPILLEEWRGVEIAEKKAVGDKVIDEQYELIKEERMPDGRLKRILRDKQSGKVFERIQ
ncbi:MAG: Gfo/Idh/MocA family oxidoreductase [candidate division KSB1 bacterium]|nr:Gfo/Idh/MocA family oxidoreductase [candidate division KSB1 bacterium]